MSKSEISLVLGSGGARGLAHIGVIRCLEEEGYRIRYISGSSMGALVGGIYAAGKLDEYTDWVLELDKADVLRLLDWSFSFSGLFKGEKIINVLKTLIGECDIKDLEVGFTAVATDLNHENEVWLNSGSLFDAIRASIAVPMVFEPVIKEDRLLVDGGLINPIPIAPALNNQTDLIFAVDLNAAAEGLAKDEEQPTENTDSRSEYRNRIASFLESLIPQTDDEKEDEFPGLFDLMMRSMDVMQTTIARFKIAAYSPDLTVGIPRDKCGFFEFYRARELIEFGHARTREALQRMERK